MPGFDKYRQAAKSAERRGKSSFTYKSKRYKRSQWANGVSVWKRASGTKGARRSARRRSR